jgi:hypothetical protein
VGPRGRGVGDGQLEELGGQARPLRALAQEQVEEVLQAGLARHGERDDVAERPAPVARAAGEGAGKPEPVGERLARLRQRRRHVGGGREGVVAAEALVRRGREVGHVGRTRRPDGPAGGAPQSDHATRSSPQ